MRVHELAKALNVNSKDLLTKLKGLKIDAKGVMSTLDADAINRARKALGKRSTPKTSAASAQSSATTSSSTKATHPAKKSEGAAAGKITPVLQAAVAIAPRRPTIGTVKSSTTRNAVTTFPRAPIKKATARPTTPGSINAAQAAPSAPPQSAPPKAPPRPTLPVSVAPTAVASKPHDEHRQTTPVRPQEATPAPQKAAQPAPQVSQPTSPAPSVVVVEPPQLTEVLAAAPVDMSNFRRLEVSFPIIVKDLAAKLDIKASELIKLLMQQKVFASIIQPLDQATAMKVAQAFHVELIPEPSLEEQLLKGAAPNPAALVPRAPVVTFMGHVDHGKTSLLDSIREAKVAEKEAGGITQHIGAYEVALAKGRVTFLDTPGHEAFSALRARGANMTDIVVLVVAADDGVMPQTVEAIDHAKAADVPILVAINKIDKPEANPQKVKQQLTQYGLLGEDWGGKTIMVSVSARTREGIDDLLEMLLLEAELLELKADPTIAAQGTVIEAKQTRDRGPVATLLVQQGTLRIGDTMVVGHLVGRVRAMHDDRAHRLKEAGPAKPVEVLGLPEVPQAGDRFLVVADEKVARQLADQRKDAKNQRAVMHPKRITLEELHQRITEGKLKDLRFILKADVQGSMEAIVQSLQKLDTEKEEVQLKILHMGVGDINESDVILAAASDAIIVGFHVGIEPKVQVLAVTEGVDVHIYQIIYELIGSIKAAIEGLLEPTIEETFLGRADVRRLFQVSRSGIVAGCFVSKGFVRRDAMIRIIRGRERVGEVKIAGLKRVKDDAREVQEGLECGILLEGNIDLQVGDLLEAWEFKKVARKLA